MVATRFAVAVHILLLLATEPGTLAQRIDEITAGLGATSQWIEQQAGLGPAVEPTLAPAAVMPEPLKL